MVAMRAEYYHVARITVGISLTALMAFLFLQRSFRHRTSPFFCYLRLYTSKSAESIIIVLWNKGGMRHAAFKKKFKFEFSQKLKFTQKFKSFKPQKSFFEQQELQLSQQQELFTRFRLFWQLRKVRNKNGHSA
jgi:hypothetical protein